jgi:hypothetical protein
MKTLQQLLPFIILQFSFYISVSAQLQDESQILKRKPGLVNYVDYEPQVHKEIDTVYYPYYNDVQMLRICFRYSFFDHPTFVKTDIYEYIQQVPVYLFRNKEGKILKRFNTLGREISTVNLHHADDPHQDQWEHDRLKRNAYVGDPKNRGLWGIYPMYVKSDNDKILVGAFDSLGNTFIEPIYESIEYVDSIFIVMKNGKYGLLDFNKKKILDFKYDEITYKHHYQKFIFTKRDGKCGIYFSNGKNFVAEEYESITESNYLRPCYVMIKNGKYYFADPNRKKINSLSFTTENVRIREKNLLLYENSEWILIDTLGKKLCRSKNEITEMVNPNRFLTTRYDKGYFRQLVDSTGKPVKENEYFYLNKLNSTTLIGWYEPEKSKHQDYLVPTKAVFLDIDGNQVCDEEFESLEKIDEYYLKAYRNGKMYFINDRGRNVIDEKIDGAGKFYDKVYFYTINGKYRLFDPQNPYRKTEEFDQISYKAEGMLGVKKGEKYGFLDSNMNVAIEFNFDQIQPFHFGVALVKIKDNWFLIDKLGNIISDDYKMTQDLGGGFTMIKKNDKFGVINNKGKVLVEPEYEKCVTIKMKKDSVYGFILRKDKKDGMIGTDGKIIHPFIYETLYEITGYNSSYEFMREGYYAGGWKHNRTTREFYHFNYDSTKTKVDIKSNPNMGFEITFGSGGKRGVSNWAKKIVIPEKYHSVEAMKFNTFKVCQNERGCGLMDTNGKVIIPIGYIYLRDHYDDFITVGRNYQSDWGLYKYDGTMIADTIYGGFERSHFGMIPYYASFNHRIENKQWVHDEKRVGLMDSTGKIIVEANYDSYQIPDQFKAEFLFINPYERILVNSKGQVLERNGTTQEPKIKEEEPKKNFFQRIFKSKKPKWK